MRHFLFVCLLGALALTIAPHAYAHNYPPKPPQPPPPHQVTGAADVYCDVWRGAYVVTGSIDGQPADSVTPATIPLGTVGVTPVVVTRGDTSYRTSVTTSGDCGASPQNPPRTITPPAVLTPPSVVVSRTPSKTIERKTTPTKRKRKTALKPPVRKPPVKREHVCLALKDGTPRFWWKGGFGRERGCYPARVGQGSG